MKTLVTGGTGFVGRALIPRLIQSGHEVIATSRDVNAKIAGATVCPIAELGPDTDWHEVLRGGRGGYTFGRTGPRHVR